MKLWWNALRSLAVIGNDVTVLSTRTARLDEEAGALRADLTKLGNLLVICPGCGCVLAATSDKVFWYEGTPKGTESDGATIRTPVCRFCAQSIEAQRKRVSPITIAR